MLAAVWFVWAFVSLATFVHFHVVVHVVDPVTAEVVHAHTPACVHGHQRTISDDRHPTRSDEWHGQQDWDRTGDRETCPLLSAAQHTSSVLITPTSLADSPRLGLVLPAEPHVQGERDIALLALAPKLPPPHLL